MARERAAVPQRLKLIVDLGQQSREAQRGGKTKQIAVLGIFFFKSIISAFENRFGDLILFSFSRFVLFEDV